MTILWAVILGLHGDGSKLSSILNAHGEFMRHRVKDAKLCLQTELDLHQTLLKLVKAYNCSSVSWPSSVVVSWEVRRVEAAGWGGGGFHSRWCMETRFLHNINCKVSQKWENCVIRRKKTQLRLLWNEAGWFGKYSVTKENKPGDKRSFRIWRMGAKFMLIYSLQSKHSCCSCTFPYFLFLFKPFSAWGNTWLTYQLAAWDGEKVSYQTVSVAEKWFP